MENREELVRLIEKQVEVEKDQVTRLAELQKKVHTAAAQILLYEMELDSQKHASILSAILKALKGVPPSKTLWDYRIDSYVEELVVKKELQNHMKMETDILDHIEKETEQTADHGLKLLLQNIAEDEKKHHKLLQTIERYSYEFIP
jgi:rubrerythrin